jgi:hypothetical protein
MIVSRSESEWGDLLACVEIDARVAIEDINILRIGAEVVGDLVVQSVKDLFFHWSIDWTPPDVIC